jgi:hypothetical protein
LAGNSNYYYPLNKKPLNDDVNYIKERRNKMRAPPDEDGKKGGKKGKKGGKKKK